MTVIAFRSGIMACDSCCADDTNVVYHATKIVRLSSGALLGSAGECDDREIVALLDKIKDPKKLPTRKELEATKTDYAALLAFAKGGVWVIEIGKHDASGWAEEGHGIYQPGGLGPYYAVGSGAREALAAMDAGADARKACEIACKRVVSCRSPVYSMRLLPFSHKKTDKSKK